MLTLKSSYRLLKKFTILICRVKNPQIGILPISLSAILIQTLLQKEASPYYLFHPDVPKRVADLLPDVRPIVFLREPIARAYSHYQYNYKLGIEQRSFENAVHDEIQLIRSGKRISIEDIDHHRHFSYISRGLYLEQLNHWLNYFPREKMYISLSEEFFDNPQVVVKDLFAFLNVEILELSQSLFVPYNHNSYRIEVADELRQYLKKFIVHLMNSLPHNWT